MLGRLDIANKNTANEEAWFQKKNKASILRELRPGIKIHWTKQWNRLVG